MWCVQVSVVNVEALTGAEVPDESVCEGITICDVTDWTIHQKV